MPTKLDNYTSTGVKFWLHKEQMENYRNGNPGTIISTHISPEGACNLDCSYCSVHKRTQSERLKLDDIKGYVKLLKGYGLKAVIFTGGGEPTSYKYFNEAVEFIHKEGLKVGLITNGTLSKRVQVWDLFSWVRVSLNVFDNWEERINIPKLNCTVGCSYIYTGDEAELDKISAVADRLNAEYIRVLPDCRNTNLEEWHDKIDTVFDKRFMHQYKVHITPRTSTCHQSYFRPYLHESGYVFPCDSVVLNESPGMFLGKFRICHWSEFDKYLERKIKHKFDPTKDCHGCVFSENIKLLDDWKTKGIERFGKIKGLVHGEFV